MTTASAVPTDLRVAVLVASEAAVIALGLGAVAEPAQTVAAGVAIVAASYASQRLGPPVWLVPRQLGALAVLAVAAATSAAGYLAEPRAALVQTALGLTVASALLLDTIRDHVRAVALAVSLLVLAVATGPDPALAVPFAAGWAGAVAGLVLAQHRAVPRGVQVVAAPASGRAASRPGALGRTVAVAMVTGLLGFLLVPQPETWSTTGTGQPTGRGPAGAGSRSAQAYGSGVLDMRDRGQLSDAPLLDVPGGAAALWRANTLVHYDGVRWRSRGVPRFSVETAAEADLSGVGGDDRMQVGATASAQVRSVGRRYPWVVAPGRPLGLQAAYPALAEGDSVTLLAGPEGGRLAPYTVRYAVRATAPPAVPVTDDELQASVWTALPPSLPARVKELAREVAGDATSRDEAVRAVEQFLASHATYRLDSRVPAPGEDAVDAFLFRDRTGFCEQFAAAATVLLRSLGVPARMATGFNGATPPRHGRRILRERDAHAWVEVWYPGAGWVPSDPTAGVPLAASGASVVERLTGALTRQLSSADGRRSMAAGLAAAVLMALGLVHLLRRRRRMRRTVPAPSSAGVAARRQAGALFAAYRRLEHALATAGVPRAPAESLDELAGRLPDHRPGEHPLRVVARACYAEDAVPAAAALDAAQRLDEMSTAVLVDLRAGPLAAGPSPAGTSPPPAQPSS